MNNTHYIIMNEDKVPIAIFKKSVISLIMDKKITLALQDETGELVTGLKHIIDESGDRNKGWKVEADFEDSAYDYEIIPTWLY